jgi:hypothetical protein
MLKLNLLPTQKPSKKRISYSAFAIIYSLNSETVSAEKGTLLTIHFQSI